MKQVPRTLITNGISHDTISPNAIRFHLEDGHVIEVTHRGDHIDVRGTGGGIGKLAIEPAGANQVDVRVLE